MPTSFNVSRGNRSGVKITTNVLGKTFYGAAGMAALGRVFEQMEKDARDELLTEVLVEAIEPMRQAAEAGAPDDPATTGRRNLPPSVIVSSGQKGGRAKNARTLGKFWARVFMGPTKYGTVQGLMQEFGTRHHGAQPFMRPAWDAHKRQLFESIRKGMWGIVKKALKNAR